jgi:glycosyltransferase involved in cell wall biosynthesis
MAHTVSAVIPVYNGAAEIRRSIESVLCQTRPVDELIVVDDGSKDATADIVRSYGSRVRLVTQANAGVAAARNHGAREARSEWLALLDHDDAWLPRKIERQMAALERNPEAKISYTGFWMHALGGAVERRHLPAAKLWPAARIRNPFPPSVAVVRRAELLASGGFTERLRGASCEDWEFFVRFLSAHPPVEVPEPLTNYFEMAASNSRNYRRMLPNTLSIVETLLTGLKGWDRIQWRRRIRSMMYFRAAISAVELGDQPLPFLTRALWNWPFPQDKFRYKHLPLMVVRGVRTMLRPAAVSPAPATETRRS